MLEVLRRAQVAQAADHVLGARQLDHPPPHLVGALAHPVYHHPERDVVSPQLIGIEPHLILPHEAADRRHFRHAGNRLELIADEPVLEAPQIGQAVLVRAVNQ